MLFHNVTLQLLGSDDFPVEAKQQAAIDLTNAARTGQFTVAHSGPLALNQAATAHDQIDADNRRRVLDTSTS